MKRLITSIALLVCVVMHAQEDADQQDSGTSAHPIKIGIKAGLSLPSLSDNSNNIYTQNFESYASFEAGVFAEYGMSDLFSLQVELNYTVKGGERSGYQPVPLSSLPDALTAQLPPGTVLYGTFDNKSSLEYLEIPILAKVGFGSDWRFFANAGPYFGILLGATQDTAGASRIYADPFGANPLTLPVIGDNPVPFNAETDINDDIKDFNVGVIGGIGVMKSIASNSELMFEVRGTYGFIPLQENSTFGKSKIGSVLFSLGYVYKL